MPSLYPYVLFWLAVAAVLFWPRHGLWARMLAAREHAGRRRREDVLKHLAKAEANGRTPGIESVAGAIGLRRRAAARLLAAMEAEGLVGFGSGALRLEQRGRELAVHVIRAHRLWESYLAEQTGLAETAWHESAEKKEHLLTPAATEELAARLGHPTLDPHGDRIPELPDAIEPDSGFPMTALEPGQAARVIHIEDEPKVIFASLVQMGLRPGLPVTVTGKSPTKIAFTTDGQAHELGPILAQNISVLPLTEEQAAKARAETTLARLAGRQKARVIGLTAACRGAERRRLLDLGFVPGTEISVEMVSPAGDPTAYRVRGCLIALRREQANMIRVSLPENAAA